MPPAQFAPLQRVGKLHITFKASSSIGISFVREVDFLRLQELLARFTAYTAQYERLCSRYSRLNARQIPTDVRTEMRYIQEIVERPRKLYFTAWRAQSTAPTYLILGAPRSYSPIAQDIERVGLENTQLAVISVE